MNKEVSLLFLKMNHLKYCCYQLPDTNNKFTKLNSWKFITIVYEANKYIKHYIDLLISYAINVTGNTNRTFN